MVQHYYQEDDLESAHYYRCKAVDHYNMCSKFLEDSHKELNAPPWNNLPTNASPAEVTRFEAATSETNCPSVNDMGGVDIDKEAELEFMSSTGSPRPRTEVAFRAHKQAGSSEPAATEDRTGHDRQYDETYGSADDSDFGLTSMGRVSAQADVNQQVTDIEFKTYDNHTIRHEMTVLAELEQRINHLSTTVAQLTLELPGSSAAVTEYSHGPTLPMPILADVDHYATAQTLEQLRTRVLRKEQEVTILENEKAALELQLAESHNLRRRAPRSGQRQRSTAKVLPAMFDPIKDAARREDFTNMGIPSFPTEIVKVHEVVRAQETAAQPTGPDMRVASPQQELITTLKEEFDSGDDLMSLRGGNATPPSKTASEQSPKDDTTPKKEVVSPTERESDSDDGVLGFGSGRSQRKDKSEENNAASKKKLFKTPIKLSDSEEDNTPLFKGCSSPQSTTDRSTRKRRLDHAREDSITSKKKRVTSPIAKFGEDDKEPWERPRPPPRTPRRGPPKRRLPQAEEDVITSKKKVVRTLKELSDSAEKATPKKKLVRPPVKRSESPKDITSVAEETQRSERSSTGLPHETPRRSAAERLLELEGGYDGKNGKWLNESRPKKKQKPWYDHEKDEESET